MLWSFKGGPLRKDGESFVFIVREDSAVKVPVSIGIENDIHYEILEGLKMGDLVVVSGGSTLRDGDKVTLVR